MLSSSTTGSNRKRAREERKEEKEEEEEEEEDGAGSSSVPEPASGEPLLKQACCFGGIIFPPVRVIKANIPALFTYLYIPEITESPAFGAVLSYMLRIHNRDGSYLPVPGPNPLDNLTVGCFLGPHRACQKCIDAERSGLLDLETMRKDTADIVNLAEPVQLLDALLAFNSILPDSSMVPRTMVSIFTVMGKIAGTITDIREKLPITSAIITGDEQQRQKHATGISRTMTVLGCLSGCLPPDMVPSEDELNARFTHVRHLVGEDSPFVLAGGSVLRNVVLRGPGIAAQAADDGDGDHCCYDFDLFLKPGVDDIEGVLNWAFERLADGAEKLSSLAVRSAVAMPGVVKVFTDMVQIDFVLIGSGRFNGHFDSPVCEVWWEGGSKVYASTRFIRSVILHRIVDVSGMSYRRSGKYKGLLLCKPAELLGWTVYDSKDDEPVDPRDRPQDGFFHHRLIISPESVNNPELRKDAVCNMARMVCSQPDRGEEDIDGKWAGYSSAAFSTSIRIMAARMALPMYCPICTVTKPDSKVTVTACCGRSLCTSCLISIVRRNAERSVCPYCRAKI